MEKEPKQFVLKVLLWGAILSIPCVPLELGAEAILKMFFDEETLRYAMFENTLGVGFIEELSKFVVLMIFVWRNDNFDYTFDGIVYACAASLGFAALENIEYIISYGAEISIGRAIFSIPGHTTFGVFMGYYLSRAKKVYCNNKSPLYFMCLALIVPTLIHGAYDFLLSNQAEAADLAWIFIFFVVILDFISWRIIKRQSKKDQPLGITRKIQEAEIIEEQ